MHKSHFNVAALYNFPSCSCSAFLSSEKSKPIHLIATRSTRPLCCDTQLKENHIWFTLLNLSPCTWPLCVDLEATKMFKHWCIPKRLPARPPRVKELQLCRSDCKFEKVGLALKGVTWASQVTWEYLWLGKSEFELGPLMLSDNVTSLSFWWYSGRHIRISLDGWWVYLRLIRLFCQLHVILIWRSSTTTCRYLCTWFFRRHQMKGKQANNGQHIQPHLPTWIWVFSPRCPTKVIGP